MRMASVHPTGLPRLVGGRGFWLAVALLCTAVASRAQGNLRTRTLVITTDTTRIDSFSVAPGSFTLWKGTEEVDTATYRIDPFGALLIRRKPMPPDTLIARYRVLPLLLTGPVRHKDPDRLLRPPTDRVDPFKYEPPRGLDDPLGVSGLNRSGSVSRGILFGNNQDLSVNSTLNLELSGRLTDHINVLASITDNNIPIQADGSTLELQDFDQVFIKLFGDPDPDTGAGWDLIAGDFVLQRPKAHFLTYLKKTKGLGFGIRSGSTVKNDLGVSAAVSKGRFARDLIQGIEGVQGPYRLRGDQGESFIIVLSGTERVYIDGQPLTRGQENDYVIDYNTAEIIFTANRLITKDRRISVEFQYSDRNYARSLVRLSDELKFGANTALRLNVYTEQDHGNQPSQQALTDEEKLALDLAGDDPLLAVVPGADSVSYSATEILYAVVDTLGYSPVYRYSTNADSAQYRVTFTNVGQGNGDYVQSSFTPNGRVFQWLGPDTVGAVIVHRGTHAPVRVLVAPKAQRMVALGLDHRVGTRTTLSTELAFSDRDQNTFSSVDDGDNNGLAARVLVGHTLPVTADSSWKLMLGGEVETLTREFTVVERYRAVEFERDWNALGKALDNDQLLSTVSVGVNGGRTGTASINASTFQVRERYDGWRQGLVMDLHPGGWDFVGQASALNTIEPVESSFLRHKATIARRTRVGTIGYRDEHEFNRYRIDSTGALATGSYRFYDWEGFLQSPDTFKIKWRLASGQRYDHALKNGALAPSATATHYSALLDLARDPRKRLAITFTYRQLAITDSTLTAQKPEDSYLARIDHDLQLFAGAMNLDVFYEFNSGLEPRREFVYVQVPAGQGVYVWIDYNADGIQQLNEFEIANFGYEADYVRVQVPTSDYVRAFGNQFNASLDLRAPGTWNSADGLRGFLGKFSDFALFRADRKTGTDDLQLAINPFVLNVDDTAMTASNASTRNTIWYDRSSTAWSMDHTYQLDRGKNLLMNGFESRVRESHKLHLRWNTTPKWTAEAEGETGRSVSNSDLLSGRTYAIDQESVKPTLTFQPGTTFRAIARFTFTTKQNSEELGNERAEIRDLGTELRWNDPGKGSITGGLNLVAIVYDGEVNSSLGNEMLAGLKPGDNLTWNIGIQRRLSDHLQIDLTYNGRKSEGTPAVHVGGAQVRAFF